MRRSILPLLLASATLFARQSPAAKGVLLESLTWEAAERVLRPNSVVVIPLGAALKEHGLHLPLNNDWLIAEHCKRRVLQDADRLMAPIVPYFYYPVFRNYPGSTTLGLETAIRYILDLCRSFMEHGIRRFYVLNTGVTTLKALQPARDQLAKEGALLSYADPMASFSRVGREKPELFTQGMGGHADEQETSWMLAIAPAAVNMGKALQDQHLRSIEGKEIPNGAPSPKSTLTQLVRNPRSDGRFSPTGAFGNPTLATREKGLLIDAAFLRDALEGIELVRIAPLPKVSVPISTWPLD